MYNRQMQQHAYCPLPAAQAGFPWRQLPPPVVLTDDHVADSQHHPQPGVHLGSLLAGLQGPILGEGLAHTDLAERKAGAVLALVAAPVAEQPHAAGRRRCALLLIASAYKRSSFGRGNTGSGHRKPCPSVPRAVSRASTHHNPCYWCTAQVAAGSSSRTRDVDISSSSCGSVTCCLSTSIRTDVPVHTVTEGSRCGADLMACQHSDRRGKRTLAQLFRWWPL